MFLYPSGHVKTIWSTRRGARRKKYHNFLQISDLQPSPSALKFPHLSRSDLVITKPNWDRKSQGCLKVIPPKALRLPDWWKSNDTIGSFFFFFCKMSFVNQSSSNVQGQSKKTKKQNCHDEFCWADISNTDSLPPMISVWILTAADKLLPFRAVSGGWQSITAWDLVTWQLNFNQ